MHRGNRTLREGNLARVPGAVGFRTTHALIMPAVVVIGVVGSVFSLGCTPWAHNPTSRVELLRPATASEDIITLEIFFARIPLSDQELNQSTWGEIDELSVPAAQRQQLTRNGFRVGLVSGSPPSGITRLLKIQDKPSENQGPLQNVDVEFEPTVRRRLIQLRSGRSGQIAESGIYDQLSLLVNDDGQIHGQRLLNAQCLFSVKATAHHDGGALLQLQPEIHHDQPKRQYSSDHGILRMEYARPKEVFDRLTVKVPLSPGDMLVCTSLPDRPGSLGASFFSSESPQGGKEQKLLVVRLAQRTSDGSLEN